MSGTTGDRVLGELGDGLMRLSRRRTQTYPGSRLEISAFRLPWLLTEVYDAVLDELGSARAEALVAELGELNDGLDRAHSRLRPEPRAR